MNATNTTKEKEDFPNATVGWEVKTVVTRTVKTINNKLPKVPLPLYEQIVSFLCEVSEKKNAEAIVSLTIINNKWVPIVWHQETSGTLHVKFDVTSESNQALINEELQGALDQVHCTIHSHNKAAAGQSPDDKDDELMKPGWHATIGNCNSATLSTHLRFNIQKNAEYGTEGEKRGKKIAEAYQSWVTTTMGAVITMDAVIASPVIPKKVPQRYILSNKSVHGTNFKVAFPDEWMDRVVEKKTITTTNFTKTNTAHTTTTSHGQRMTGKTGQASPTPPLQNQLSFDRDITPMHVIDFKNKFSRIAQPNEPVWLVVQMLYQIYQEDEVYRNTPMIYDIDAGNEAALDFKEAVQQAMKLAKKNIIQRHLQGSGIISTFPLSVDITAHIAASFEDIDAPTYNDWHSTAFADPQQNNRELCMFIYEELTESGLFPDIHMR